MRSRMLGGFVAGLVMTAVATAYAQEDAEPKPDADAASEPAADAKEEGKAEEPAVEGDTAKAEASGEVTDPSEIKSEAGDSPYEKPDTTYYFVGARYRGIIVPKFMMNLFGDGGTTVYVDNLGLEAAIRKNDFEYVFGLTYADYAMEPTPFKASSDPDLAWEIVESEIKVLYLTVDFLWSSKFNDQWALNFGVGAGFGIVWGDLHRVQAFPDPDGSGDYLPCAAVGVPRGDYCANDNEHYGDYTEPSWANGGSKPVIFPWLAPLIGARFKPHRHFVARLDAGFGITGFFVGLGADYGL
jgi:hypothetical protein